MQASHSVSTVACTWLPASPTPRCRGANGTAIHNPATMISARLTRDGRGLGHEFLPAPKLGWCADDRGLQRHASLGLKLLAVRNIGEQPNRRNGFRMCSNCEAPVFSGAGNGLCFYDSHGHDADEG